MSTYLVALVISDFKCKHSVAKAGLNGKVDVRVCARPNAFDQLDYALKYTVLTLETLEKYFGVRYTISKLDHVAIPDLSFRKFNEFRKDQTFIILFNILRCNGKLGISYI